MSDYSTTVDFYLLPYLKKYLVKRYGISLPYKVRKADSIGSIILSLLTKNRIDYKLTPLKTDGLSKFTIKLSERFYTVNGMFVAQPKIDQFNSIVERMFREELYNHVILSVEHTKNARFYKKEILSFLSYYGIFEDDIPLDNLIKDFKRRKQRHKTLAQCIAKK